MSAPRRHQEDGMKSWMMAAVLAAGFVATPAMAQQDEPKQQELHMDGLDIEGNARRAQVMRMNASERAKFRKVSRLKKSLLGKLTAREVTSGL